MTQSSGAPVPVANVAEVRAALECALGDYFGTPRRVTELVCRPSAYRTSFMLDEVDARLDDGTTLQLIRKDVSRQALPEAARQAKPVFLHDPLREIETYRLMLAPARLGTAICYGTIVDEGRGRYWLFLERVAGVELYQVGEFATWREVARWLAALHARYAGDAALPERARAAHLLRHDGDFYRLWIDRARRFSSRATAPPVPGDGRGIEWLAERYDRVVERLIALPVTFIHGEFFASNVLVRETAGGLRVCPVDWELAAVGSGLIDLAALTAGGWTEEQKSSMALAYYAALPANSQWFSTPEAFLAALDCCRLHLAVQWLGWSEGWSPPAEHVQDWLGEALSQAEKLGL